MHLVKTPILRQRRFGGFGSASPMALLARITTMQRFTLALVLLLTSLCGQLFGQASPTGAVNGTLTDPSGNVVPGARVVLLNESTNIPTSVTTNTEGQYRIQDLLPAAYNLTVEAQGFKSVQVSTFRINVNQTLTQDVTLQLGELSQKVEVFGQGELVERTTVELSTVIQDHAMRDLPLNGRNYSSLITLTPGANGTRISGNWGDANNYLLDGASNTTVMGGTSAYVPILDTIQEFSIEAHSDKAEYGSVPGATVSVVTRSGGNRFTGSAWEFVRNNIFGARNPITQATLSGPPAFRQNQFGGTFSGPVIVPKIYNGKNKTFFFFAYERFMFRQGTEVFTRVPTANELAGNFSDSVLGRNIFDPATTRPGPGNTVIRDQFPNNIIPANRINAMTQGYLKLLLPAPNYFNPANLSINRLDIFPSRENKDDYSIRLDHKFSDRDSIWFHFAKGDDVTTTHPNALVTQENPKPRRSISANWIHLFTPHLFSDFRFSYSYAPFILTQSFPGGVSALESLGYNPTNITAYNSPILGGGGAISLPGLNYNYGTLTSVPYGFSDSISWIKGKHNVKFGLQFTHKAFSNIAFTNSYSFNLQQTADPQNVGSTGIEFASLLLGLPNTGSLYNGVYHETSNNWGGYVQDEWKVRSNLTINLGLRYDTFPTPAFHWPQRRWSDQRLGL